MPGLFRLCLIAILSGVPCSAQAQLEIVPYLAAYSPTTDFSANSRPGQPIFGMGTGKQRTAVAVGGSLRYWTDPRFGFEFTALHGSSEVRISQAGGTFRPDTSLPASVTVIGLAGLFRFPLSDLPNPLWVEAGAIRVSHRGDAFRGYAPVNSLGGSAGLGTSIPLSERLRVDIGFKALFYQMTLRDSLGALPGNLQIDLMARAGIALVLGRTPE